MAKSKRYCPNCPKYVKRPKPRVYFDRTGKIIRHQIEEYDEGSELFSDIDREKAKAKDKAKSKAKARAKARARLNKIRGNKNKNKNKNSKDKNSKDKNPKDKNSKDNKKTYRFNRAVKTKDKKDKERDKDKDRFSKKHLSRHTYYGIDRETDVTDPVEGDTFLDLLNGEWSIYRHGIWNKIPSPAPRSYLGPSTGPDASVPMAKEGSLYFDAEGRIYVYQSGEWQLVPISMTPSLPAIKLDKSRTTLMMSPDFSNSALQTETFNYHLKPSNALVKMDITTNNYYKSQLQPNYGHHNALEFQVIPKGKQRVTLTNINEASFILNVGNWIQYVDNGGQSWQTVIGIADLELNDKEDYKLDVIGDNANALVCLMDGKYLSTIEQSLELKISLSNTKSNTNINKATWSYVLLAYPVNIPKQFYVVKDFHDLENQIDHPLPMVKITIP